MDSGRYEAKAYAPQTQARVTAGELVVTADAVRFEGGTLSATLPMAGLVIRRGGHNEEQIFFEHPEFPGWSIYSADPALARDPIVRVRPEVAKQLRAADKSRRGTPMPVKIGLF